MQISNLMRHESGSQMHAFDYRIVEILRSPVAGRIANFLSLHCQVRAKLAVSYFWVRKNCRHRRMSSLVLPTEANSFPNLLESLVSLWYDDQHLTMRKGSCALLPDSEIGKLTSRNQGRILHSNLSAMNFRWCARPTLIRPSHRLVASITFLAFCFAM